MCFPGTLEEMNEAAEAFERQSQKDQLIKTLKRKKGEDEELRRANQLMAEKNIAQIKARNRSGATISRHC